MKDADLTIETLELTLFELGWYKQASTNPKMSLWLPSARTKLDPNVFREEAGVFLPSDKEAPDFHRLLQRAASELARLSAENVLEEFDTSEMRISRKLDKFVASTDGPAVQSGVVDWRIGANLVKGLSEILMSGARAAHQNKRWYNGTSKVIANNYLDSCLMGQTEVGSYVVKAFVPADAIVPISNSKKVKKQSQMTARQVSETVLASVEATKEVLEEFTRDHNPEAFEWAMTQGVSVEMLDGFRSLISAEETEISVEFIGLTPDERERAPQRSTVVLKPTLREAVEVGFSTLRETPHPNELVVAGEVIGLMRQFDEPDSRRIKMRGPAPDGKTRVFTVHLGQDDYEQAMQAHKKQVLFQVNGTADKGRFIEVKKCLLPMLQSAEKATPLVRLQEAKLQDSSTLYSKLRAQRLRAYRIALTHHIPRNDS